MGDHGTTSTFPTSPAVDQVFELTLDGDAAKNKPLEMVRRDGYNPKDWKHKGPVVEGSQTKRFKLVKVGYCRTLDELRRKLGEHGEIPEGQWREALAAYKSDGKGPVGIADSSWAHPRGSARFPCVFTGGDSDFFWSDYDFHDDWRWLVGVSK